MRAIWIGLIAIGLIGCAGATPQVDNVGKVARNVAKGLPEQSRLLMCLVAPDKPCNGMPGPSDRDVVRAHVRDNATLSCEIVTRDDSASASTSAACQCARATSPEDFETSCSSWAGVK
jgi:hypothetical protein